MKWSNIWPWRTSRATSQPARRLSIARLAIEHLEERLVLSTTSADQAAYEQWRQQQYSVGDLNASDSIQLTDPVQLVSTMDVSAQADPTNGSFGSLIGLPTAFSGNTYRGAGYSVAVIDTGIDYTHADLGGGFGAGYRVVAGWDFVNNDANPLDDNGHGTHVAGIIGSSSATYSGVAPNVNLIALKVLDASGSGSFGKVEDALKWVAANQSQYNIVAVNLSLGSGNYTSNPYTFLDDEFSSLKSKGVFIAVAAGNSFYSNNSQVGLDFPAIHPGVVSVGAVYSGNFGQVSWSSGARDFTTAPDRVASFSQRGTALSLMAPGALINSTYLGNTYRSMAGTSMAAPVVAGAAALLHQAMDARRMTANQDTILNLMKSTAANVIDGDDENDNVTNTGLSFKRLNLGAAMTSLGPVNAAPVLQPIANQSLTPGRSVTITLSATDAENNPITYSARVLTVLSAQAYSLDQQFGLRYSGAGNDNFHGMNEKWFDTADGKWFCMLPNGELRRWAPSVAEMQQSANLVATFDARYWTDPNLLANAPPSSGRTPVLSVVGNQLTIQTASDLADGYQIEVAASDGASSSKRTFTLSVRNSAPVLQAISNRTLTPGSSATIILSATDAENDAITYSARIVTALSAQAYSLDQQLGLRYSGAGNDNFHGMNEKWFDTPAGKWFCILPNGELRRWASRSGSLQ
jgi:subtilisin family serine protease